MRMEEKHKSLEMVQGLDETRLDRGVEALVHSCSSVGYLSKYSECTYLFSSPS